MAQKDPWAEFQDVTPSATPARPTAGPTTRTILALPNPQQDLENQLKAAEEQRKQLEDARKAVTFEQEQQDRTARGGVATTESEKTAAFLATRVANGLRSLSTIKGGQSPELDAEAARLVLGDTAANYLTSEERQRVETAQRDVLDAALTLGTGAAYTVEQLEGYRRSYFPQLGDTPANIADKQRALKVLLEAAKVKAGAAAPAIDEALAAAGLAAPAGEAVPQTEGNAAIQAAFDRGASREELLALAQSLGVSFPGGEARLNEMIAFRDGGGKGATFVPQAAQEDPRVKELADQWEARNGPSGLSELATQGITLGFADEAGAIGSTAGRLLRGETDVAGNYQLFTAVERELIRRARERTGGMGTAAELIGGGGAVRALGAGAATIGGAIREGATIGGVTGFGYGEGTQGSIAGAAGGAALGGALGGGIQRLANRGGGSGGAGGNPTPPNPGGQAIQAADNLNAATGSNIRLMPADVSGPGLRNVTGGAAKMTLSGEIIGRRAEGLTREAEKAKDALVTLAGGRAENEVAGEVALEGARKWMKASATKRDALYAKARRLGGDQPVDLANARQVLDGHIAELSQTPGSAVGVERLRTLRAELDQPFPVEGVKRMRTRLRDDFGSDGLRATDIERRVGQVIDAAEDDIITSLQGAGKGDAATAYAQASKAHRDRVEVIDEVLAPIIGRKGSDPRSGEQIIRAIEQAAQSNSAKLGRFVNTLPAEDAGVVRGTIIDRLGRASAGQQDAGGNAFSLNTFLTNWSKMSDRAKSALFGGELRASLDDLAKVANARRESGRFVNFSNTGSTVGNLASGGALMGSVANPAALSLFAVDGLTGAILSSPRLARWLAKMPSNPRAQRVHIEGLSKIAAADSAIAADALGLQRQLLAAFDQGPVSLAAQDQNAGSNTTAGGTR